MRGHAPHGGRNPLVDIGRRLFRIFIVSETRSSERREVRHGKNGVPALFVDDFPVLGVLLHFFDFNVSNGRGGGDDELFFQRRDLVVSLLRHLLLGVPVFFEVFDLFLEIGGFLFGLAESLFVLDVPGTNDVKSGLHLFGRRFPKLREDFPLFLFGSVLQRLADFAGVPHGKTEILGFGKVFLTKR